MIDLHELNNKYIEQMYSQKRKECRTGLQFALTCISNKKYEKRKEF